MLNQDTPFGLYINGQFRPSSTGGTIPVENPKDGRIIAHVAEGEAADIDAAIDAAGEAGKTGCDPWRRARRYHASRRRASGRPPQ